jgi:hypothetical protein
VVGDVVVDEHDVTGGMDDKEKTIMTLIEVNTKQREEFESKYFLLLCCSSHSSSLLPR